jgi:hypothetical protein
VPGESAADKLRRAVEESKTAGERVKANREARRQERSQNDDDTLSAVDTAILHTFFSDDSQINLEHVDDPHSTAEALSSPKAAEWRASEA